MMDDAKKDGTDQVSVAKTQPIPTGPYVRQSADDDGGCTIGESGKIAFYLGFFCLVGYGAFKLYQKKNE